MPPADPAHPSIGASSSPVPSGDGASLGAVLAALRCPICRRPLRLDGRRLACASGHGFDLARQGYVNLAVGRPHPGTADTAGMVIAREQFLARNHYRPLADLIAARAARHDDRDRPGIVVDLAGGTGYYLAAVLDQVPHRSGLCVDLSAPALRRAAHVHPHAAAIGADVWDQLPLDTAAASTVITVFGPRNAAEIERILAPGGVLITASPTPEHLQELIDALGLLSVDRRKPQRHAVTFNRFHPVDVDTLTYRLALNRRDVAALAGMGPTARHVRADAMDDRVRALAESTEVTVSVRVSTYRR